MKKALLTLVVLGAVGGSAYWYYDVRPTPPKFTVTTAAVTRGDIVEAVGATGTLQALTTVQVGSQVSGNIAYLGADFNSIVKKGQILARLDPSLFEAQIQQSRANLAQARANYTKSQSDLERTRVQLTDAEQKYARAKELSARSLLPQSDLDTAKTAVESAQSVVQSQLATVTQTQAAIAQAEASVNQNQVNLEHTVITAPIDGLVISRNVDVGQTVAASMQAPTLFILAADLTKMQVVANLDESDVGRIRPNQTVTFRVDAYAADTFRGTVSQVRLNPIVQQNVVTYATVINVPNDQLKLKPGMTANVNIEIARSTNVLRIPNGALRFRPTNEMYAAIGQTPPDPATLRAEFGGGGRRGGAGAGSAQSPAPAAPETKPSTAPAAPSQAGPRLREGVSTAGATTPPAPIAAAGGEGGLPVAAAGVPAGEPRDRGTRRGRGSAGDFASGTGSRGGNVGGTDVGGGRGGRGGARPTPAPAAQSGATTIDALFGPLPRVEGQGRVWLYVDKQLKSVRIRTGISDGQATELLEGDITQGSELVTNISTGGTTRPAATAFPFGGQPGRGGQGGFGGGGFAGGGNRGGGGRQ